jgi:hypothetical protein
VTQRTALRFARWSGASALIAALLLVPVAALWGGAAVRWSLLGWLVTALAGVAGGTWLVSKHGARGQGFLIALGVCMLARLILFVAAPFAVAPHGAEAAVACIGGLFAGYLPTQATEIIWIARRTARA